MIFPIFKFWVMADCIYNLRWHTRCVTDHKKKLIISGQTYRKDAHRSAFLVLEYFLCDIYFEIWSILYMVDFVLGNIIFIIIINVILLLVYYFFILYMVVTNAFGRYVWRHVIAKKIVYGFFIGFKTLRIFWNKENWPWSLWYLGQLIF